MNGQYFILISLRDEFMRSSKGRSWQVNTWPFWQEHWVRFERCMFFSVIFGVGGGMFSFLKSAKRRHWENHLISNRIKWYCFLSYPINVINYMYGVSGMEEQNVSDRIIWDIPRWTGHFRRGVSWRLDLCRGRRRSRNLQKSGRSSLNLPQENAIRVITSNHAWNICVAVITSFCWTILIPCAKPNKQYWSKTTLLMVAIIENWPIGRWTASILSIS